MDIFAVTLTLKSGATVKVLLTECTKTSNSINWKTISEEQCRKIRNSHPRLNDYSQTLLSVSFDEIAAITCEESVKV